MTAGCEIMDRKLLFLARAFPPSQSIASVRNKNVAKYLARRGWQVTVATVKPSLLDQSGTATNHPNALQESGIEYLYTDHKYRFLVPGFLRSRFQVSAPFMASIARRTALRLGIDNGIGWHAPLLRTLKMVNSAQFDIVLATGSPYKAFEAAARIAKRLECQFVVDYRDLWTNNPHRNRPLPSWIKKRESRLLELASAVLVVSPSMAVTLDREFGCGVKTHVITNGFDPDEFDRIPALRFESNAIVYAGGFYPPEGDIDPFMSALSILNVRSSTNCKNLKFHYYGPHGNYCLEKARSFNLEHLVVNHGMVDRSHVIAAIKGSRAALVITTISSVASTEHNGIITGKLFEPLGAGTPILLIAPKGNDARSIVEQTGAGRCFTGKQVSEIAVFIEELCAGKVKFATKNLIQFSWPQLAKRLDLVLTSCLNRK